jgi:hypothetical protein
MRPPSWPKGFGSGVTPPDKYYGRKRAILKRKEKISQETMKMRRELNRMVMLEALPNGVS